MTQINLLDGVPPREKPESPVSKEKRRIGKNAWRVLHYLQAHGSATNYELCTPEVGGLRAIGRVHDLRLDGWNIVTTQVGGGVWKYELLGMKS